MNKATYTRAEGAERVGVGLNSFDKLLARNDNPIPHFNVGRRVLIPKESLEEWLKAEAERKTGAA